MYVTHQRSLPYDQVEWSMGQKWSELIYVDKILTVTISGPERDFVLQHFPVLTYLTPDRGERIQTFHDTNAKFVHELMSLHMKYMPEVNTYLGGQDVNFD